MKHHAATDGVSAADIERRLDKVAVCIKVLGPVKGRALLPLYERYEQQLAMLRGADDLMAKVMNRLRHLD